MGFKVGDIISETIPITEKMVQQFAEVSGDFNPMHMDEAYAKTTRFGRRIAHGMLSASFISRVLATKLGPGGIYLSQSLKFLQPIFIGDTVEVILTVESMRESKGIASVATVVKKTTGEICVKGDAMIMDASAVK